MRRTFAHLFADHPREVGETYVEHMGAASKYGVRLARLSALAFLHAVMPGVAKTVVSDEIKRMAKEMSGRSDDAQETRMRDNGAWDPGL